MYSSLTKVPILRIEDPDLISGEVCVNFTIERMTGVAGDFFTPEKRVCFDKFYWPTLAEIQAVFEREFAGEYGGFEVCMFVENDRITLSGKHGRSAIKGIAMKEHFDAVSTLSADPSMLRVVPDVDGAFTYPYVTDASLFRDDSGDK